MGTPYGRRGDLWKCGFHSGLDLKSVNYGGDGKIYPVAAGTVAQIGAAGSYGKHVYIRHDDGYISLYAHLRSIMVGVGDRVSLETVIGAEGSTGNATGVHLHVEIHDGEYRYPAVMDPKKFLDEQIKKQGGSMTEYYIMTGKKSEFEIFPWKKDKTKCLINPCFNLDYFGGSPMQTVCNLAANGQIIAETATLQGANTSGKKQTTLITTTDGRAYMALVDRLSDIPNLRCAIGGVPFMIDGREVSLSRDIKTQGWSGGNFYKTWHGFLTVQNDEIWYIAANIGHSNDVTATTVIWEFLKSIGCTGTVIKLDGGGSFFRRDRDGRVLSTAGNRVINYMGTFRSRSVLGGYNAADVVTFGALDDILQRQGVIKS